MSNALIYLDRQSDLSFQTQIRERLVTLLLAGALPADRPIPSSRKLAQQLGVSRNTVVLACERLLAEGYLLSRQRSGLYVNPQILEGRAGAIASRTTRGPRGAKFVGRAGRPAAPRAPAASPAAEFSFVDGRLDTYTDLAPAWREATRLSLAPRQIEQWAANDGTVDDAKLVEEIRTRILPARGIYASPDQILITLGARQALSLATEILVSRGDTVALEEPCRPDTRELLRRNGARLAHMQVDAQGMVVDARLDACALTYVTPSHQVPTAVTMSMARRRALLQRAAASGMTIVEDDRIAESNYTGHAHPALYCLDRHERVIYVSSLSRVLGPWVRIGFMVAPAKIIAAARERRQLSGGHAPLNNQSAAAYFLALGHYDGRNNLLARELRRRWTALRDALNHYLHRSIVTSPSLGGSALWIRGPEGLNAAALVSAAAQRGLAIEPVDRYYATGACPENCFRMGVSAIPLERIRPGVAQLAQLFAELDIGGSERLESSRGRWLRGAELRACVAGATLRYPTVYCDPCTIELHPDGRMVGRAGARGEDQDCGRWWIDGDLWCRQWQHWAYGEASAFYTVIDGRQIKWFDRQGRLVDSAEIELPAPAAAVPGATGPIASGPIDMLRLAV